ncbi:GspH/FimT family pseudopilin [Endozoicomonas ascidiicola]|uniref:GspH/FimT family pseudopilin n=1 Tax=Endozoicomonas ascidiicola TaxID=1698521 RepID=UPI000835FC86|nr:GspH/FimT family pseudopilin [Endozoicomonas ascidiicola]
MSVKWKYRQQNTGCGFTLVELLITLAVFSIVASIAYPSFTQSIANNRVRNQAQEIQSILSFARSEAITRDTIVTITPDNDWVGSNGTVSANGVTLMQVGSFTDTNINSPEDSYRFDNRGLFSGGAIAISDANSSIIGTVNGITVSFTPHSPSEEGSTEEPAETEEESP